MEGALSFSLYFVATFLAIYFLYKWKRSFRYKLPPGPFGWPLVGNFKMFMGKGAIRKLSFEMRQRYGDVISLKLGPFPTILVNDYDLAVDALVNKFPTELAGRPLTYLGNLFSEGGNDIAVTDYSPRWKMMRKLVHSALRQFAQGKQLQELTQRAFEKFKRNVEEDPLSRTEGINPFERLYWLSYNIMCAATYGADYDIDDEEFNFLRGRIKNANDEFLAATYIEFVPLIHYLPLKVIRVLNQTLKDLITFFNEKIQQHRETLPESKEDLRDITDFILAEERSLIAAGEERSFFLQDVHIRQTILDIFSAGTDTTTFTMSWIFGLLSTHPDIQQRCFEEIQAKYDLPLQSFGKIKREDVPYVDATLHEIMRYGLIVPLGVQHKAMSDCKIGEFDVPKDTQVLFNLYCFAYDPKYWDNPEVFDPQRFLSDDGKLVPKKKGFMPFSCGRRVCLGEAVAKADLFLITVAMLSEFKMEWSEENEVAHIEEKDENAFIRELKPHKIRFLPRRE